MSGFALQILDSMRTLRIENVEAFSGEDRTGSFGILAGHERFMTTLVFGLASFRESGADWQYLAVPGALLYFEANELTLSTRHFLIDADYERISAALDEQLLAEEEDLRATRESLRRMEEEALKRLWRLGRA